MEESFNKKHYSSGWHPLSRENSTGEFLLEASEKITQNHEKNRALCQDSAIDKKELAETLTAISKKINDLSQEIHDQSGKLDHLVSILDEKGALENDRPIEMQDSLHNSRFLGLFGNSR